MTAPDPLRRLLPSVCAGLLLLSAAPAVHAQSTPRLNLETFSTGAVAVTVHFEPGTAAPVDLFRLSSATGYVFDPVAASWELVAAGLDPQGSNSVTWIDATAFASVAGTYAAGYADQDSDGDGLSDARELLAPPRSLVIALGGEDQAPTDPADPNHGVFVLALDLRDAGYNVRLYDEDLVTADGSGAVYNAIVAAVQSEGVTNIALFGYSHGAGSIYHLVQRLQAQGITGFTLAFTGYIDAVRNNSDVDTAQELRRPAGSLYHVNYYQEGSFFEDLGLDGGPTQPPGADFEENRDDPVPTETHFTVDDEPAVLEGIRSRLVERVTP